MALFYVKDLELRGGFSINITKGWFEDLLDSVDIIEENYAVLDIIANDSYPRSHRDRVGFVWWK